jgi:hypothetical protein
MTQYYGCEVVKDEEAYKLDFLLTDKENFLDFISQLRTVTKSDEPLILLPTRKKGKSSSAKIGSCHWAVTKMIEQHLGKLFCGFTILQSSSRIDMLSSLSFDNKINCLDACFHSGWLTPEEKAVNLINYTEKLIEKNKILENTRDYLLFKNPTNLLFLPTNKKCYFKITSEGEYTFNNITYFHKRKKSLEKYEIIKKFQSNYTVNFLPKDEHNYMFGSIEKENIDLYLNKIVMIRNYYKERMTPSINNYSYFNSTFPLLVEEFFSNDFKNNFKLFTEYLENSEWSSFIREVNKNYNEVNNEWVFKKHFDHPDRSKLKSRDLFSKPSLITKKYHYEQGNHPLFDDRIEYRTIDKNEVNDEIKRLINSMSQSQKNYEIKRAEKKGITLEQYILKQKFKLSN